MDNHAARAPGTINDPDTVTLSDRQATRLAALTRSPARLFAGKTLADLRKLAVPHLDPSWLVARTICGRVVKTDAAGVDHPVPFATVKVHDTDLGIVAWSPSGLPYSWFYPLYQRRHLLATVTTDECGRFCVRVPRWEIDWYLRWRKERQCYTTWLRRPDIRAVLAHHELIPHQPDPGPLPIDDHLLRHAARVLAAPAIDRMRSLIAPTIGATTAKTEAVLAAPAFSMGVRPPLDKAAAATLADRRALATRLAIKPALLDALDPRRFYGPFLRCRDVVVPQWHAVLDIPDLTFEVTQDVDGDGDQEVIYSEGLFEVRWDAGALPDVTLHASSIAVSTPSCDAPTIPAGGAPAILFAGNYALDQAGQTATPTIPLYQDTQGYSVLVNPPDLDGDPGTPARGAPAQSPFVGSFDLWGQSEAAGATHYRIVHQEAGGPTTYLGGGFNLRKKAPLVPGGPDVLQSRDVVPVDGWYPIVHRSEDWIPYGKLAPVNIGGTAPHSFRIEMGTAGGGGAITAVPGSLGDPVQVYIDNQAPDFTAKLWWRHPTPGIALDAGWLELLDGECPVVVRAGAQEVQFKVAVTVTANHLRDYEVRARGCSTIAPTQIALGGTMTPARHWHTGPNDNTASLTLYYQLAAGAPAGCYHFAGSAHSRAFDAEAPVATATGQTADEYWTVTPNAPRYNTFDRTVAVQ